MSLADDTRAIIRHLAMADKFADQADERRILAGKLLLDVRAFFISKRSMPCKDGLYAKDWHTYVEKELHRSMGDVRKLMAIARSADPKAALAKERETRRAGMRKSRKSLVPANGTLPRGSESLQVKPSAKRNNGPVVHLTERELNKDNPNYEKIKDRLSRAKAFEKGEVRPRKDRRKMVPVIEAFRYVQIWAQRIKQVIADYGFTPEQRAEAIDIVWYSLAEFEDEFHAAKKPEKPVLTVVK